MITAQQIAKIQWNCRRGMLELDLILQRFMATHFDALSEPEKLAFERLLSHQDPDLYVWLMGQMIPEEKDVAEIVAIIRRHYYA